MEDEWQVSERWHFTSNFSADSGFETGLGLNTAATVGRILQAFGASRGLRMILFLALFTVAPAYAMRL